MCYADHSIILPNRENSAFKADPCEMDVGVIIVYYWRVNRCCLQYPIHLSQFHSEDVMVADVTGADGTVVGGGACTNASK